MSYTIETIEELSGLADIDKQRWAYLALTGKLENAVRDHLAFSIQSSRKGVLVGRDLAVDRGQVRGRQPERYDMAILQGGQLVEVMEAKQFCSFNYKPGQDCLQNDVQNPIRSDLDRLELLRRRDQPPAVHMLILVCSFAKADDGTPENFGSIAKYGLDDQGVQETPPYTGEICKYLNREMKGWSFEPAVQVGLGQQFGLKASLACIVGSLPAAVAAAAA